MKHAKTHITVIKQVDSTYTHYKNYKIIQNQLSIKQTRYPKMFNDIERNYA